MRVNIASFDINSICRFCVQKENSLVPIFEMGANDERGTAAVLEIVDILLQEKVNRSGPFSDWQLPNSRMLTIDW